MKRSIVMCGECNKEFNVYTNNKEYKNWYADKPLKNCKAHTKENKKTTIHKTRRNK